MSMPSRLNARPAAPPPTAACAPQPWLDALRAEAAALRLAPRAAAAGDDCALRVDSADPATWARALLRLLPKISARRVRFHRPGAASVTFDEAWLARLLQSLRAGDLASAEFAIASRAPRPVRRPLRFLAEGLAARLDRLGRTSRNEAGGSPPA